MHSHEILFLNGKRASLVIPSSNASPEDILHTLSIQQPKGLILIIGSANNLPHAQIPRLSQLFSQGIASAAHQSEYAIIDGGTHAGVMAMIGEGVALHGHTSTLLGVSPSELVTYPGGQVVERPGETAPLDPNHSHFVLVESNEWGGETEIMFALAAALAAGKPTVTILVNGGAIAQNEALQTVRHGWPLLVIEGSGRLADEIASLWREQQFMITDEKKREILNSGQISLFPLTSSPQALKQHILSLLADTSC